jgi:serine/threonine protein kinase
MILDHDYIGPYRITHKLGSGGMASVYCGKREGRQYAIKVLRETYARNQKQRRRFAQEARIMRDFDHPNIVKVFDYFESGDSVVAMIMEKLDGLSLSEIIHHKDSPSLSLEMVWTLYEPILAAVQYAHDRGCIHRDIKPGNVIVAFDRVGAKTPKLLDFGLARVLDADNRLSTPGLAMGTHYYMSPEQCRGDKASGAAADIYSLGITLYEMLTGMVPFHSEDLKELQEAHINDRPKPPSHLTANIPAELDAIILKALAKDPRDRWRTARELTHRLESVFRITNTEAAFPEALATDEPETSEGYRGPATPPVRIRQHPTVATDVPPGSRNADRETSSGTKKGNRREPHTAVRSSRPNPPLTPKPGSLERSCTPPPSPPSRRQTLVNTATETRHEEAWAAKPRITANRASGRIASWVHVSSFPLIWWVLAFALIGSATALAEYRINGDSAVLLHIVPDTIHWQTQTWALGLALLFAVLGSITGVAIADRAAKGALLGFLSFGFLGTIAGVGSSILGGDAGELVRYLTVGALLGAFPPAILGGFALLIRRFL